MSALVPDLLSFLAANPDITAIDAVFVDANGRLRGKRLPRDAAAAIGGGSVTIPQATMALTTPGECLDAGGRGISDGDPDGIGLPVAGSVVRLPWATAPTAQVFLRLASAEGAPLGLDPRDVLDRVVTRLAALGLRPVTAFEVEFYVIDRTRAADGAPLLPAAMTALPVWSQRSHAVEPLDALAPFFATVEAYAAALGLRTGGVTAETGIGQFEINLIHGEDPGRAADEVILLRQALTQAARACELDVTFMAKPMADRPGNGLHLHLSLIDAEGRNIFAGEQGEEMLRFALGGLRAMMPDVLAIQAPNHNSYRRFVPGNFVPVNRSWGRDNRSVALRVPSGSLSARRIEHRMAGGDAHPHLVMATVLAGVVHGLENRLDPGPASDGNANLLADPALPRDLSAALDAFSASPVVRDYLGAAYVDLYTDLRRKEFDRLLSFYSPKEYEWYL
ncbi:glutamine synthetase [Acidisoma cellulosilytica]|uniref:Glutamine synthetase n=1 Tax=Acidisoma cellulosilyticum TaxID=2802395 RepID=A0A963Z6H9_9PROT|nr:glutamine synthetase family protein [Acidisoma cellulosilyticum]MCB8883705.1 glutamine synthetase [Acidisoma cellulosilyticum]